MSFTSAEFIGFLAGFGLLYAFAPRSLRCALLAGASYLFYWLYSGWFAMYLFGATVIAFFAARSKSFVLTAAALLIAALVLFKSFAAFGAGSLVPLGVSYFTFKLAGYLFDAHWGVIEPERRLVPFLAFSAFFPQIVGGPIQRAQSFLPQVARAEAVAIGTAAAAVLRILLGFFKKFVVADNLAPIVNYVYGHLGAHPGAPVLLGFYGYPLQMYADFSGLTDIAIGAGMLFGIDAPENFNAPFWAASPSEMWRRWHMSLTTWMTDYVFTPLRMSLRNIGNVGLVISLFVNMLLIGLWHGFYLTFALWGVVHAVYLSVDALTQKLRKRLYKRHPALDRITDWLGPVVTFHLVAVAFVFFRADSLATIGLLFRHLFAGLGAFSADFREVVDQPQRYFAVLALGWLVLEGADALRRRFWLRPLPVKLPRWGRWSIYGCTALGVLLTVSLLLTGDQDRSPFLYAIF